MSTITQTEQDVFRDMCVCVLYVCMHVIAINKKRSHEFDKEQGAYGKVWKEEREGGNDVIIL